MRFPWETRRSIDAGTDYSKMDWRTTCIGRRCWVGEAGRTLWRTHAVLVGESVRDPSGAASCSNLT